MTNPQHSETVKRWDYSLYQRSMMIDADGDYVLYTDYAALVNGRDALVEALKHCADPGSTRSSREETAREALKKAGAM